MLNLHASLQGQTVETTSSPNPRERNGTANNGMSDYTALAHEPASIASLPTLTSTRPIPQTGGFSDGLGRGPSSRLQGGERARADGQDNIKLSQVF